MNLASLQSKWSTILFINLKGHVPLAQVDALSGPMVLWWNLVDSKTFYTVPQRPGIYITSKCWWIPT